MYFSLRTLTLTLVCCLPLLAVPSHALSDTELVDGAEVIFVGKILDLETTMERGQSISTYRLAVEEVLAGQLLHSPAEIRTLGQPFAPGESWMLFLDSAQLGASAKALDPTRQALRISSHEGRELVLGPEPAANDPMAAETGLWTRDGERFRHWIRNRALDSSGTETDARTQYLATATELLGAAAAPLEKSDAWTPDKMCSISTAGSVEDDLGDADSNPLVSPSPDLESSTVTGNNGTLTLISRYDPATFDPDSSRTHFYIDTDSNRDTGFPRNRLGVEFILRTNRTETLILIHFPNDDTVSQFRIIGTAELAVLTNGFATSVPLSTLADEGALTFRVYTDVALSSGRFTNFTDYMPDLGIDGARTFPTSPILAAPSGLQANPVGSGRVNLSWNDNSDDEQRFEIERRRPGNTFANIGQTGPNGTFFSDDSAAPETTYQYRVRGVRNDGCPSNYSEIVSVTTGSAGEAQPTDLTAETLSFSQVRLTWNDNAGSESGYEVQARAGDGAYTTVANLPANSENADLDGLNEGTDYTFRVRATGGEGDSAFSNEAGATTFFENPEPCVPGPETLCLRDGRFRVQASWRDFGGNEGPGSDAGLASTDSGLLYFFEPGNWELLVKVLDGCDFNGHFWVFAAATTDVQYDLVVTDSLTGLSATYSNQLGVRSPAVTDIGALATCAVGGGDGSGGEIAEPALATLPAGPVHEAVDKEGACMGDDNTLCLQDQQYQVTIEWQDFAGNEGVGTVDELQSSDSGLFSFFDENNLEVLVKVLDGCNFNGHYWVFAAATTNVQYNLEVTEMATGERAEYFNPLGRSSDAITDTLAFASCP